MDFVTGKININLVGEKPFVHRDPISEIVWSRSLRFLKEKFPYKQLCCASDSYITDTPLRIQLSDIFEPKQSFKSSETYVSHVFHQNGNSIDSELDSALPTPECLGEHAVKHFRIKRLVAGPSGTGTALHQHSRAYFHNIIGVKRWFLACPSQENEAILSEYAYDVNKKKIHSISEWFNVNASKLTKRLSGCSQIDLEPGDSLYIPDGYYHAVLNMEFTAGVAFSWEKRFQIELC
jgi:mannose-6-phosphate isomerase-like protein (cupin superfamily)